jgi:hypothetical protein
LPFRGKTGSRRHQGEPLESTGPTICHLQWFARGRASHTATSESGGGNT